MRDNDVIYSRIGKCCQQFYERNERFSDSVKFAKQHSAEKFW